MKSLRIGALCFLLLPLLACTPQPRTVVVLNNTSPNTFTRTLTRITPANHSVLVTGGQMVNPDCTVNDSVTLRIEQQPVHGKAHIVSGSDFVHFPLSNPRSACNTQRLPGKYVEYMPEKNFTGADFMMVSTFMLGGELEEKISITVK